MCPAGSRVRATAALGCGGGAVVCLVLRGRNAERGVGWRGGLAWGVRWRIGASQSGVRLSALDLIDWYSRDDPSY